MSALRAAAGRIREMWCASGLLWTATLMLDRAGLPALRFWPDKAVSQEALAGQVAAILRAWGMSEEHISITVEHLLYSDLHGIDSHGCGMLPDYHRGLVAGRLTMTPKIEVVRENETTALIDGGGGLGHVPADTAMKLAIAKCRHTGLASVVVRNSGHFGAAGTYAAMAAREGFIGIATTNTRKPSVVPTFGTEAMFGTNPIAFAAPAAKNRPFLLDMATSTVAIGKIFTAWRRGRSIPTGWALDLHGKPLRNARLAGKYRRLTPLGATSTMSSHKGYGLGAMVEILSSVLPGMSSIRSAEGDAPVGHFFLALNPRQFCETGTFEADLDLMMDALRASKPIDPKQPVLVAGDPEYAAREKTSRDGVMLSRSIIEDMRMICRTSGTAFTLDT